MPSTTSTRKRKGAGNIQKKANGSYLGRIRITGYDTYYYTGTSEKDVQKNFPISAPTPRANRRLLFFSKYPTSSKSSVPSQRRLPR